MPVVLEHAEAAEQRQDAEHAGGAGGVGGAGEPRLRAVGPLAFEGGEALRNLGVAQRRCAGGCGEATVTTATPLRLAPGARVGVRCGLPSQGTCARFTQYMPLRSCSSGSLAGVLARSLCVRVCVCVHV